MIRFLAKFIKVGSSNRICSVELIEPHGLIEMFEVFANNTTLIMFRYLTSGFVFQSLRDYPDM